MSNPVVAVVGATGAVGRTMLSILQERGFPADSIRLLASSSSAGTLVDTRWGEITVEDLDSADPGGIDIALFSAGGDRSRAHAPRFVEAGAVVVDNSSAFRMSPDVPLVVVGVNDHAVTDHGGIIANPNCTTMTLLMAAAPLHRAFGLEAMEVTSFQSVSGSGKQGIDELIQQHDVLRGDIEALQRGGWDDPGPKLYSRPIGFNVLPHAGSLTENSYTDEEMKLVNESRKILEIPDLEVEPTCVRVPVVTGHGVAASLKFSGYVPVSGALEVLEEAVGVQVWTDRVPTPLDCAGLDDCLVGRVRAGLTSDRILNLWVVGDNLRKGAALNAVQIAELLV